MQVPACLEKISNICNYRYISISPLDIKEWKVIALLTNNDTNKVMGIVTKIMDILKAISFGDKYFEIATTLREAELIKDMLTDAGMVSNKVKLINLKR
jgi:hypothetical protein